MPRLTSVALLTALATGSCGTDKEDNLVNVPEQPEVAGCSDIAATNFSRSANSDDGSCSYDPDRFFSMTSYGVEVESASRKVTVLMQVMDESGRGAPGLQEGDFVVAENGRKIGVESNATINAETIPFSIPTVLLLDLSSSVEGLVSQIKDATIALINTKTANQEIAVYVFDREARLVQEFTSDATALVNAVIEIPEDNLFDSTNLYGAIIEVSDLWQDEISMERIVDGSLVIFTDGFHNADPSLSIRDAVNAMVSPSDGMLKKIYVAALDSPDLDRAPLQQLSFRTNGFFEAGDVSGLQEIFLSIQSEIADLSNSFYILTYTSPITNPEPNLETLEIAILGNSNTDSAGRIAADFESEGFGQ